MSKGLILEKNLPHQDKAIDCTTRVFSGISVSGAREAEVNPVMNFEILNNKEIMDGHITRNVRAIQKENNIDNKNKNEYIFDIQMETGTGKTYTYTKTIFELNIKYNLHKFIIVVPSLAIKAGTVNFLKNSSTKEHFRQEYNKEIKTYVVENKKSKSKKSYLLQSIKEFSQVRQTRDKIHVLIINSGMINSKSMLEEVDVNLFENINTNFEALKYIKPVIIIDEPHKFASSKSTFKKITDLEPQFILRYGATFNDDYFNLVYNLNAIDAFNNDLVKGINAYVEEFKEGENSIVKLLSANSNEASFELIENNKLKKVKLGIKEFLDSALKDGRIKYAGFSFHDKEESFPKIVDSYDWTFCQIQYNYLDENFQAGKSGLDYAASKGLGIVIMEPLRGGKLAVNLPENITEIFDNSSVDRTPAGWALSWVLNHSEVAVILSGMGQMFELEDNLKVCGEIEPDSLKKEELEVLDKVKTTFRSGIKNNCTACGYCMPCPFGVNIPRNFAFYNDYHIFGDKEKTIASYNRFVKPSEKASNCAECGKCESHCPQAISIIEDLKKVEAIFEA